MTHIDRSWVDNSWRVFLGPSIAVKANLQTLFTNKQLALMDKPRGQIGPFVHFTPNYKKGGSFSDITFESPRKITVWDKNITFSEFSLVHQSHDSDLTLNYL